MQIAISVHRVAGPALAARRAQQVSEGGVARRLARLEQQRAELRLVPVGPEEGLERQDVHLRRVGGRERHWPLHRVLRPRVADARRAKVAVLLEPPTRKARVGLGDKHGVAQPVEAAVRLVALAPDGKLVTQQRRKGPRHDHIEVEVDATLGEKEPEPEHVGAVRGGAQRPAEDRFGRGHLVQRQHAPCRLPPLAMRQVRVVQLQHRRLQVGVRREDCEVVREAEVALRLLVGKAEDEVHWSRHFLHAARKGERGSRRVSRVWSSQLGPARAR